MATFLERVKLIADFSEWSNSWRVYEVDGLALKVRSVPLRTEREACSLRDAWQRDLDAGLVPMYHLL